MKTDVALWIAIVLIFLQAIITAWLSQENSKSFWRMAGQVETLIALLAQRIEHEPSKLGVEGSNPSERATFTSHKSTGTPNAD